MDVIIDDLVTAGYFRARIRTLSDFDKIIGGMAWAMQVFSHDIDIKIFYMDSLDLGQKIALTERLVMVLLVMNCPHSIEPHQIVGLDYVSLLPVIRWLIKRSTEVRQEHEAFNRLLALRHFHRVTNSFPDRNSWCHLIPLKRLVNLSRSGEAIITDGIYQTKDNDRREQLDDATSLLLDKINKEFTSNQQVSLIKLPSLFKGVSGVNEDHQLKRVVESSGSSDEYESKEKKIDIEVVNLEEKEIRDEEGERLHKEQHKELDIELLATNQKILNLLRKLDSMPSDMEISQYQRRYIELHQQLISKNKDVKKLYALFNSLESTKHYLTKEITLLDSIFSNLDLTNNSEVNKDLFLSQFQEIVIRIQGVRDDMCEKLDRIRERCAKLNLEFSSLLQ